MRLFVLLFASAAIASCDSCENPKYWCNVTETCCKQEDATYACCPYPEANCCADGLYCCPSGYECDVDMDICNPTTAHAKNALVTMKKEKLTRNRQLNNVPCLDGQSWCPIDATCCLTRSGRYGCCPTAHGTCCVDQMHCCPDGQRCDPTGRHCNLTESNSFVESLTIFPATIDRPKKAIEFVRPHKVKSDVDKHEYPVECGKGWGCSRQETCCVEIDAETGVQTNHVCCPLSRGVCCRHSCCPRGYKCEEDDTCVKDRTFRNIVF